MSQNVSLYQSPYSTQYRRRRRWVPKGVMLLAILFMVGLLGACHSPSQPVAAIAVPVDTNEFLNPAVGESTTGVSNWMVLSGQDRTLARQNTVALNTF